MNILKTIISAVLLITPLFSQVQYADVAKRIIRGNGTPAAGNCANMSAVGSKYQNYAPAGAEYTCQQTSIGVFGWVQTGSGSGTGNVTTDLSSSTQYSVTLFADTTGTKIGEATGCTWSSTGSGKITCVGGFSSGDGTKPSVVELAELTTNGTNSVWLVGAESQSADTCTIFPAAGSTTGKVLTDSGTTASIDPDGAGPVAARTCRVLTWTNAVRNIGLAIGDPAGSALSTGVLGYTVSPVDCTIVGWNIIVDSGTATVDIWKIASGTAKPTVANTITASAKPAISTGTAITSTTLTGWTTTVTAGDLFGFNLDATSGPKFILITARCQ